MILEIERKGVQILMVQQEMKEVIGISDSVIVIGEGKLRGDLKNENIKKEKVIEDEIGKNEKKEEQFLNICKKRENV